MNWDFNWTIIFRVMGVIAFAAYIPTGNLQFTIIGLELTILSVLVEGR